MLTDQDLINKIKEINCENSLLELIQRYDHYCGVFINKFSNAVIAVNGNIFDLLDDKKLIIYRAVMSFNNSKKTKFSSWLATCIRYHCLKYVCKMRNNNEKMQKIMSFATSDDVLMPSTSGDAINFLEEIEDDRVRRIFLEKFNNSEITNKELAAKMKCSTVTIKKLIDKGRVLLKAKLCGKF